MVRIVRLWFCAVVLAFGGQAVAQDRTMVLPSPIMVVDFERIFVETLYGRRIAEFLTTERVRVQAENDRIAAELLAEENALTQARATMDTSAFGDAARAFNERAQAVRRDREAEQAKLIQLRDSERAQFLERIRPIILALMLERGAVVAMDRRAVLQAIGGANATQDAIDLIDTTLGDGSRDPSDRPILRPVDDVSAPLPEVAPIIANDAQTAPVPQDDLPQSE